MFSPEIAKKASFVLDTAVEQELIMLFNDLVHQRMLKIKANSSDLELRISAVEVELLNKLKNYRQSLGDAVKHGTIL